MALSRYLAPQMKERHWGRIIFMSSIMGLASFHGRGAYSATKSALLGLCRAAALELGSFGITVNCIAPGPIVTDLPKSVLTEEQFTAVANRTALGRWGNPKELVGPALLLASQAGDYIGQGQTESYTLESSVLPSTRAALATSPSIETRRSFSAAISGLSMPGQSPIDSSRSMRAFARGFFPIAESHAIDSRSRFFDFRGEPMVAETDATGLAVAPPRCHACSVW